jgi:hypothetical protein
VLAGTLVIPGALGLDQAPDGSVVYVGTMTGDLYVVDPIHLTILKRYPSTAISQYGFQANAVFALADGKLILEDYYLPWPGGEIDWMAVWDPTTNAISLLVGPNGATSPYPETTSCTVRPELVMLANNRTRVLMYSGSHTQLCSLDPETGTWNLSAGAFGTNLPTAFALTADSNTLLAFDGININSFDATTLALKSSFPLVIPAAQQGQPNRTMFSSKDSKQLFITDGDGPGAMDVYDLGTGKMTGWIPQLVLPSDLPYSPEGPIYQAVSANGLEAGVIEGGGLGLLDTGAVHALPVGSLFTSSVLDLPSGPVNGGTATGWALGAPGVPAFGGVYFGANAATGVEYNSSTGMSAVSPPGNPGPVDVRVTSTDGGSQFLPDAFSYGPWVLESPTAYATAEGGGPASLFGYGFGPPWASNGSNLNAIPTDLHVSVGGVDAPVIWFNGSPYTEGPYTTEPHDSIPATFDTFIVGPSLPSKGLIYKVPPHSAGTTASISVSNSSGSVIAEAQMTYLPTLQRYPVSGHLADGIYDAKRDVYYFSDTNQIRVFSLSLGSWLASIPIPTSSSDWGPQGLYGLALSPDGSKLAVSDPVAFAIHLLNPDKPSSIQTFAYGSQLSASMSVPAGLAMMNNGTVYIATFDLSGDGGCGFLFTMDTSSGTVKEIGPPSSNCLPTAGMFVPDFADARLAMTPNGARVYFNDEGQVGWIDTSSGQVVGRNIEDNVGQQDYEVIANQTQVFAKGLLTDTFLRPVGQVALNLAEVIDTDYIYGAAFSADGRLLFQPGVQSIDVFDGNTGAFRTRISLPVPLSPNFRALVANGKDNRLVAITGSGDGIAVIDLRSLPEPSPLPYLATQPSPVMPLGLGPSTSGAMKPRDGTRIRRGPHRHVGQPFALPQRPSL